MANFFYTNPSGHKQGPYTEQQLKRLAAQGRLPPNTPLETQGGHKGVAGQISGLCEAASLPTTPSAASASAQVFCTNCGNAVSEQAVACMTCGTKPTGHKKFCRQCGAGINAEQIICTKCGAKIGAAIPDIMGNLSMPQVSAKGIQKWLKRLVSAGIAIGVLAGLYFAGLYALEFVSMAGNNSRALLKNAKPGDWARYNVDASGGGMFGMPGGTIRQEVISNDGRKVVIQTINNMRGRWGNEEREETEIDLSKSEEELVMFELSRLGLPPGAMQIVKSEKGKKTKETLYIDRKTFDCVLSPHTVTMTVTAPGGETADVTVTSKEWTSNTVPIAGIVKQEVNLGIVSKKETVRMTITMTLEDSGNDPSRVVKAKERKELEDAIQRAKDKQEQIAATRIAGEN
jgi:hypothetical protein